MNKKLFLTITFVFTLLMASFCVSIAEESDIVATVDGENVYLDDFVEQAAFQRASAIAQYNYMCMVYEAYGMSDYIPEMTETYTAYYGEEGKLDFGQQVLNQVIYNKILELEFAKLGVELNDDEIAYELADMFGYVEETETEETGLGGIEDVTLDIPETEADKAEKRDAFLSDSIVQYNTYYGYEFSDEFYYELAMHQLMYDYVEADVLSDQVFEEEMVNAKHILVEDEEQAREIIERLDNGEDWDTLANEYTTDPSGVGNGGALGWFGKGMMVAPFEEGAWALEPGTYTSEPVLSDFGYHIIYSLGKEIRQLEGSDLENAQYDFMTNWEMDLMENYEIETFAAWQDAVPMEPAFIPYEVTVVEEDTDAE